MSLIETFERIVRLVDLRENVQILGDFLFRFRSTADRFVQMIERRRTVFCIELANKRNDFVNRVAGNEASGELFEEAKACGEIL